MPPLKMDMLTAVPNGVPVILCAPSAHTMQMIKKAGYAEAGVNKELSLLLMKFPAEERPKRIGPILEQFMKQKKGAFLISNYEMLFDPGYRLDVLKFFCEWARMSNIVVYWCGRGTGMTLEYSEPNYSDYHQYDLEKYTVLCVK